MNDKLTLAGVNVARRRHAIVNRYKRLTQHRLANYGTLICPLSPSHGTKVTVTRFHTGVTPVISVQDPSGRMRQFGKPLF